MVCTAKLYLRSSGGLVTHLKGEVAGEQRDEPGAPTYELIQTETTQSSEPKSKHISGSKKK